MVPPMVAASQAQVGSSSGSASRAGLLSPGTRSKTAAPLAFLDAVELFVGHGGKQVSRNGRYRTIHTFNQSINQSIDGVVSMLQARSMFCCTSIK